MVWGWQMAVTADPHVNVCPSAVQVEVVRRQIREFKEKSGVDRVVILWTANTERYAQVNQPASGWNQPTF